MQHTLNNLSHLRQRWVSNGERCLLKWFCTNDSFTHVKNQFLMSFWFQIIAYEIWCTGAKFLLILMRHPRFIKNHQWRRGRHTPILAKPRKGQTHCWRLFSPTNNAKHNLLIIKCKLKLSILRLDINDIK